MSVDVRVDHVVEVLRGRLAMNDFVLMTRRDLTNTWRAAGFKRLAQDWTASSSVERSTPEAGADPLAELMTVARTRLSKGHAMELQLALEENGIHCEPALGRLGAGTDIVRIYRKWRVQE
ncbi:hypothetical protein [Kitasatospora sp. NPDC091276]|uniref:hypothetical protein n=1 Tax=Kitasatospora sp. NPDC091276 TaxID=3155300 RepID=UPI0034423EC3